MSKPTEKEKILFELWREWSSGNSSVGHALEKAYEAGRKSVLDALKCQYEGDGLLRGGAE